MCRLGNFCNIAGYNAVYASAASSSTSWRLRASAALTFNRFSAYATDNEYNATRNRARCGERDENRETKRGTDISARERGDRPARTCVLYVRVQVFAFCIGARERGVCVACMCVLFFAKLKV